MLLEYASPDSGSQLPPKLAHQHLGWDLNFSVASTSTPLPPPSGYPGDTAASSTNQQLLVPALLQSLSAALEFHVVLFLIRTPSSWWRLKPGHSQGLTQGRKDLERWHCVLQKRSFVKSCEEGWHIMFSVGITCGQEGWYIMLSVGITHG